MNYKVFNRTVARKYSFNPSITKTLFISISDIDKERAKLQRHKGCFYLFFSFDDKVSGDNVITEKDADNIIYHVMLHKDEVDTIVVNCEAGVSRSAGVCAAIMYILDEDDSVIFDSNKYVPNMKCYSEVLKAYQRYLDSKHK